MGFWSTILGKKEGVRPGEPTEEELYGNLEVDLGAYTCGRSTLGLPVESADFYADLLDDDELFRDENNGFEVGVEDGLFSYVFITITDFPGKFLCNGKAVEISAETTENGLISILGKPYWRDDSDGEVILFFEDGEVEIQAEFTIGKLQTISMQTGPMLAEEDQRDYYNVTKPWPPGAV